MESDKAPFDPTRLDDINSLETARMALRWALERLATLERLNAEYIKKAEWELRLRLKAEEELKSQLELERSAAEDAARLRAKQAAKSFAEKISAIEAEHAAKVVAEREKAEEAVSRVALEIGQARMQIEAEFGRRLTDLRLAEDRLRSREADLSERENEFDRFCSAQKGQAEAELRRIEKQAQDATALQVEQVRRSSEKEFKTLQEAWLRERSFLEREIGEWKAKASAAGEKPAGRGKPQREEERSCQALREREATLDRREAALKEGNLNLLRHYRDKRAQLEKLQAQAERDISDIARRINENPGENPPRDQPAR
ncbi:MAG: hypothetical protein HZB91_02670 [Elusimicrobia bacterium]|nr:hypothetical protein [Elusimicrobiota bacterium]